MYRLGSRLGFSRPPRPRGVPPVAGAGSLPRAPPCAVHRRLPSTTAYHSCSSRIGSVKVVDFNDLNIGMNVFILSTRNGGLGINLTSADDSCILYDCDWNPQIDLDAMDQCHRIGQTHHVHDGILATSNSIEGQIIKRAFGRLKLQHILNGQFLPDAAKPNALDEVELLLQLLRDEQAEEDRMIRTGISDKDLLKAARNKGMGRHILPFGGRSRVLYSSAGIAKSKNTLSFVTPKRTFSSFGQKAPVISQLMLNDEYEIKNQKWFLLGDCLSRGSILKPINPTGLMSPGDVIRCGSYEPGNFATQILRQGSGIIASNLMRGTNPCGLFRLENLLWSPDRRCIIFKDSNLAGDTEGAQSPYRALYDTFNSALELTTGYKIENFPSPLPLHLVKYFDYLLDAAKVDKRLITNHPVTCFPGERIQRNLTRNHVLRRRLAYQFAKSGWKRGKQVLAELGRIFPKELLTSEGLHPAIDYWANQANQVYGGVTSSLCSSAPVMPFDSNGNKLQLWVLGSILVALHRNPFEHPYDPAYAKIQPFWQSHYDLVYIEKLMNNFIPLFGHEADKCFLIFGLEDFMEVDSHNKAPYYYWTDISWVKKLPRLN